MDPFIISLHCNCQNINPIFYMDYDKMTMIVGLCFTSIPLLSYIIHICVCQKLKRRTLNTDLHVLWGWFISLHINIHIHFGMMFWEYQWIMWKNVGFSKVKYGTGGGGQGWANWVKGSRKYRLPVMNWINHGNKRHNIGKIVYDIIVLYGNRW